MHKIIHLWDKLILGDNSYPLFIGISILQQLKTTLLNSCFNECILLFSDLPDIVMETCVVESHKMYLTTSKSITYRKHVLHENEPGEFVSQSCKIVTSKRFEDFISDLLLFQDISGITVSDIQNERCPRISANDLVDLLRGDPEATAVIDLRGSAEYKRAHIDGSINIPFTSISLNDVRLETLNVDNLKNFISNRIVVIVSTLHDNAVLVCTKMPINS